MLEKFLSHKNHRFLMSEGALIMKTPKKRKIERKTNYSTRMKLLKSDLPRVIVRKSNKYITVQYVISEEAKDKIILSVCSKDLIKSGFSNKFTGSLKSIPAAYLTGYLAGKKILNKSDKSNDQKIILDIGLQRGIHGNRIFSALKGLVDAGVNIQHDKKAFPSEDRLNGKHLKEEVKKELEKIKHKITK